MTKPQVGPDKLSTSNVEKRANHTATPSLIPQPNGRGSLLSGGMPGNKGGGRPREEIRIKLRNLITTKGLRYLEDVLDAPRSYLHQCSECGHGDVIQPPKTDDIAIKCLDLSHRYAIGTQQEVEHTGMVMLTQGTPPRPETMP